MIFLKFGVRRFWYFTVDMQVHVSQYKPITSPTQQSPKSKSTIFNNDNISSSEKILAHLTRSTLAPPHSAPLPHSEQIIHLLRRVRQCTGSSNYVYSLVLHNKTSNTNTTLNIVNNIQLHIKTYKHLGITVPHYILHVTDPIG